MTTTTRPDPKLLDSLVLKKGGHNSFEQGACVMEAVAYFAGRAHTDAPPCVSKTIREFMVSWNDAMNDEDRQMLKPYVFKVMNTANGPDSELRRSWMALDWYCRISAPIWLRLAGLTAEAEAIEATAPIVDGKSAKAAQQALDTARKAAYAARAAAGAAAGDAAWAAARAAAGDAAWDAAGAALRPTVVVLQASALELLDRMIAVYQEEAS